MRKRGNTETIASVCGACINDCAMLVDREDGRIVGVRGNPNEMRTAGKICAKGLASLQVVEDPRRVTHPLRRKKGTERGEGQWEQISWDEAIDELANHIKASVEQYGGNSISFMRGMGAGWGLPLDMLQRLCHCIGCEPGMGASECFVPRAVASVASLGGLLQYADYENADLIILWGRQPAHSSAGAMTRIFDARDKRGAKLIAIDPLRWRVSAQATDYYQVEPGTDLALALAMIHTIVNESLWDKEFVDKYTNDPGLSKLIAHVNGGNPDGIAYTPEWASAICGIEPERIAAFAREYAMTPRAVIVTGHGLEGRVNVAQTVRAIEVLRMITGHVDAEGSDVMTQLAPARDPEFALLSRMNPEWHQDGPTTLFHVDPTPPKYCTYPALWMAMGLMPTDDIFTMMDEGVIKVGIVQAGNPVAMLPQPKHVVERLLKLDYLCGIDLYVTETTRYADLILPAASYMERTEPSWFHYDTWTSVVRMRRACASVGECLPDTVILAKLGHALGFTEEFPTEDMQWYVDQDLKPSGITWQDLLDHPEGIQYAPFAYKKYEQNGFATPDGKAQVYSLILDSMGLPALPTWIDGAETLRSTPEIAQKYPLVLFTGRTGPMYVHEQKHTIPWLRELCVEPHTLINPVKAAELGISDGDEIVVSSPRGEIHAIAKISPLVKKNWVYVPGGWAESNFGVLGIEDQMDVLTSQPNYMTCLGNVRKA